MSLTHFTQTQSVSKKDRIVATMKETIIAGKINSGEPIVESQLARQMKVGQPIVREALIELEHQGFVQKSPYRGTRVTKLSRKDVERIFDFRAELEPLAIEWAKKRANPEDVEELRRITGQMRQAADAVEPNLTQFYDNDLAFHRKIWKLSDNKYLAESLERVVQPLFAFFWMKTPRDREALLQSVAQHDKVVDAMLTENSKNLRGLMRNTLGGFRDQWLTKFLPEED